MPPQARGAGKEPQRRFRQRRSGGLKTAKTRSWLWLLASELSCSASEFSGFFAKEPSATAIPSHHDGAARRIASGTEHRNRVGATATTRHHHLWRTHPEPGAYVVHNPGCLSLSGCLSLYGPDALAGAGAQPGWRTGLPCRQAHRLMPEPPLTAGSTAVCYSI